MAAAPPNANSEEYELVPRSQIEYLRREVDQLRRNPFGDTKSSKDLLSAMDALSRNVERLVHILETANDEIVRDYKDRSNSDRVHKLLEQQEKLAKGIVAVADLVRDQRPAQIASLPQMPAATSAPTASPFPIPAQEPAPQAWQQNPFLDAPQRPAEPKPRFDLSGIPPPP